MKDKGGNRLIFIPHPSAFILSSLPLALRRGYN